MCCPDYINVVLPYTVRVGQSGISGTNSAGSAFRMNSIFDPLFAAGGTQPMGRDQWTPFYGRYIVNGVKASVVCNNHSNDSLFCFMVAQPASSLAVGDFTTNGIMESPLCMWKSVNGESAGGSCKTLSRYYPMKKVFGLTSYNRDNDAYSGIVGTNPIEPATLTVATQSTQTSTTTGSCSLLISLNYYVTYFHKKILPKS